MSFVNLLAFRKKSKSARHSRPPSPVRNGDALARAIAARHPSIPPHCRKRALSEVRRVGLRLCTFDQPTSAAVELKTATASVRARSSCGCCTSNALALDISSFPFPSFSSDECSTSVRRIPSAGAGNLGSCFRSIFWCDHPQTSIYSTLSTTYRTTRPFVESSSIIRRTSTDDTSSSPGNISARSFFA